MILVDDGLEPMSARRDTPGVLKRIQEASRY